MKKTLIAKYKSTCFECGQAITPGQKIKFYGSHHSEHENCQTAGESSGQSAGVVTFQTSGGSFTRNSRGRCEDAPCCGCCTI